MEPREPQRLGDLGPWLARAAAGASLQALHEGFCELLRARGLPVWRATVGLEMLHPELSGTLLTWTAGRLSETRTPREGVRTRPSYLNSPTRIVDDTNAVFRRRLDAPAPELPLLEELRGQGATDYVMFPLPFIDRTRTAVMSFATDATGGFSADDLLELEAAAALFSLYAERQVLRRIAIDLLDTYVGHSAGERIFDGRIERGDSESVFAAIWFCDLRGFTAFSEQAPRAQIIALLNEWFDAVAEALDAHGGEILKFIGDGLLAIFPTGADIPAACDRAVDAARAALDHGAALNRARTERGEPPLAFGLGLHLGEVSYGNVGSRRRLDFTVIGPAVNHASRLQELTKTLGHAALASGALARHSRRPLASLGRHALRGIDEPVEVFALEAALSRDPPSA